MSTSLAVELANPEPPPPETCVQVVNCARKAGNALRAALPGVLRALPDSPTSGSQLARTTGVGGVVCRKILAAVRETDGLMVVSRLPGVDALQHFGAAARRLLGGHAALAALDEGVQLYAICVRQTAGSQADLLAIISHELPDERERALERARAALFRGAREYSGRSCELHLTVIIVRPAADDPTVVDSVHVRGTLGLERFKPTVPLTFGLARVGSPGGRPERELVYRSIHGASLIEPLPGGLLAPFCSVPVPGFTSHRTPSGVVNVVELDTHPAMTPVDVVTGVQVTGLMSQPGYALRPYISLGTVVDVPARNLLLDVFLEKSIALTCKPALETHSSGPFGGGLDWDQRFFDRYPDWPRLRHLGPGLAGGASDGYARHAELLRYVFEALGWDPEGFFGYRCEERYPPWPLVTVMGFHHTPPPGPKGH